METPEIDRTTSRRDLIRRSAVLGVGAWVTPVVIESLASPAGALTACCGGPDLRITTPTGSNGWALSYTSSQWAGSSPPIGVVGSYTSDCNNPLTPVAAEGNGVFLVRDDPNTSAAVTARYCKTVTLCAGVKYTFTFRVRSLGSNPRDQQLQVTINGTPLTLAPLGTTTLSASAFATCTLQALAPTFTPPTNGQYTFCFVHTVPASGRSNVSDDIGETGVVITCA